MMTATTPLGPRGRAFSVTGQRVVVVGAGRSGLAAAQLLVSRGAVVTLTVVPARCPIGCIANHV